LRVIAFRVNSPSHIEESGGVTGVNGFILRFIRASGILPNSLREAEFATIVGIVARGFDIEGEVTLTARGEGAAALEGDNRVAEIIEIFLRAEELVNKALNALSGDDDRPSDGFALIKDITTEGALDSLFHEAIITIEVIETASVGIREKQTPNKIANRDLARAELRL
jgi:hypothetical protein